MKILMAAPATLRFSWELDVVLTNIRSFTDMEIVLLFTEHDFTVPIRFRDKWGCSVFSYIDRRDDMTYIPSIRPWLLWQYLTDHPEAQQETYLYIDSDIIFREWLDFDTLNPQPGLVIGSDCSSYLSYDYIMQCEQGEHIAARMAEICGITVDDMKDVPGIGAQLILTNPTAAFWERSYHDSNKIYSYFLSLDSNVQKWTAEMWAQLWGWVREGMILSAPTELDFCRPTDPVERYDEVKILHNAGVTGSGDMFFKGAYDMTSPFREDFSQVRRDKATIRYVEAIQSVVL